VRGIDPAKDVEGFHPYNIGRTPVPGGVGPMTVAMLMNTLQAAQRPPELRRESQRPRQTPRQAAGG
jgi:5,10-methylene-tetrahydrofolate dehydrogenase/methenyl tetrahydrofolate cyclohydrolase